MELFSLNSLPAVSCLPSSSSLRRATLEKPTSFFSQALVSPSNSKRHPDVRNACPRKYRPRLSVSAQVTTGSSSKTGDAIKQEMISNDYDVAFVAGATGRVGSRTVRELLKLGFRVRAGVRSVQRAGTLVESVRQMKLDGVTGSLKTEPIEKLEIVECDLENESSIRPAIGNASIVICCIGASEKEVFDVTGPYRIDYKATKNLVEAATVAEVDHFILLTSLGTNKIGFPAAILNLFWGVLFWKRKAEEALISSGLPYTIVRPGGMERPTDAYKETHNIVLANEDTYFGGQVSNLQVAELMAFMAKHRRLSFCKIVEVIAETTAPLTTMEELLARIPPKRELPPEPTPDPAPVGIESEPNSATVGKELGDVEVPKTKPLSPFTMYADLKPPTSPAPPRIGTASSKQIIEDLGQTKVEPPTTSYAENDPAEAPSQKAHYLSPYTTYDDLKPPASPTRSTPSIGSSILTSAGATDSSPEQSVAPQHITQHASRPLSPYPMYEDLKPPSSPVPSVPKY